MRYKGSKRRLVKDIMPIILKDRLSGQTYVEPFAGGLNSMLDVDGPRLAGESNPWLVAMWKALQSGWIPPSEISEEEYIRVRGQHYGKPENPDGLEDHIVGWMGIAASFGGKFFSCYGRHPKTSHRQSESNCLFNSTMKIIHKLKDINFVCSEYQNLEIPPNSLIYCDPPYACAKEKYFKDQVFNHNQFWEWAKQKTIEGHTVFVSENTAPEGWTSVWSGQRKSGLRYIKDGDNSWTETTEHLFQWKSL
jgi:DNA adenine methylase